LRLVLRTVRTGDHFSGAYWVFEMAVAALWLFLFLFQTLYRFLYF